MTLVELCEGITTLSVKPDITITGLTQDSREVQEGFIFFACPGTVVDGYAFIDAAIQRGANAVLCEANQHIFEEAYVTTATGKTVPIIAIPQLSQQIGQLAARFYGNASAHMQMIGVTGTNGKTSLTHYLAACLTQLQQPCALIGTVGNGFPAHLQSSTHTTPNPIALQQMLATFYQQGATHIAMEVSSHGLAQGRVNAIQFETAIFTNLSRDHLDYHHTMEAYGAAKRKLFQLPELKYGIFNVDDQFGQQLFAEFSPQYACYGYSLQEVSAKANHDRYIWAGDIQCTAQGISAYIHTPWGNGPINTGLFGLFNLANMLAVITYLGIQQVPMATLLAHISQLRGVKGRMELVRVPTQCSVLVDYAHTPDALEKALQAIQAHVNTGKVWCVVGCGGDRDPGKRPEMGKIAEQYADHVIITNDNPRHEIPETIAAQILAGMQQASDAHIILDRKAAIHFAIKHAQEKDVILVAGKGHENYQQVGDVKTPFSDQEVILAALTELADNNRD